VDKIIIKKTGLPRLKEEVSGFFHAEEVPYETAVYDEDSGKFICFITEEIKIPTVTFDYINSIKFNKSHRASGLVSSSQIFGSAPRVAIKKLCCRNCPFNSQYKKQYSLLVHLSKTFEQNFKENFATEYAQHRESCAHISDCWRISDTIFTSGIINNTKLRYHTDNGNIKNCFSYMLTLKKGIEGGDLHLPEYNKIVRLKHGSVILFDGASVSHGVTPFKILNKESRRYTVVWYTQEELSRCKENVKDEINYYNNVITKSCLSKLV
jgi:hypothetical protein